MKGSHCRADEKRAIARDEHRKVKQLVEKQLCFIRNFFVYITFA